MKSKLLKSNSKSSLKSKGNITKNSISSYNNLFLGVNKKISKTLPKNKESKISIPSNNNLANTDNTDNGEQAISSKSENAIILKNKWKKLQKEINIYAKKSLEELKVTEKVKINNLKDLKNQLTLIKNELQQELNIASPPIDEAEPLVSFEEIQNKLSLRKNFTEIMKNSYEYNYPTAIQSISIPLIYENKNIIAVSETGSGKTLSYVVPCFHNSLLNKLKNEQKYKIIIILPTKELSKQIYNESLLFNNYYCEKNLKIKYVNTSVILSINNDYENFIHNTDVYIGTPNNILKLIELCKENILNILNYIIFDESDKYFELGFIDYIEKILKYVCSEKNDISKIFFSATISDNLSNIINNNYVDSIKVRIGSINLPAKNISQEFIYCSNEEGKINELKNIFHKAINFPVLVFIDGVEKIKHIFHKIKFESPNIECLFSKMNKKDRENQIIKFRTGEIFMLLCSDLLSRGIDFKNVKTIINYDCPYKITNYIHRIGRTGRGGKKGYAISFIEERDVDNLYYISKLINDMKNNDYKDIKCPDWLVNLYIKKKNEKNKKMNQKEKKLLGKKTNRKNN